MRSMSFLLGAALLVGAPALAQVNGTQHPTDANGPTPPSSTSVDPQAPPATSRTAGSRPPASQNPTDANGPTPTADPQAPPATAGSTMKTVPGSGSPGDDDVSAPSTHTQTPDQKAAAAKKHRPH